MKPETRNLLIIVAGALLLLFIMAKRNARPATSTVPYQSTPQQGPGASLLGTLITTAGSVASSIWGAGSEGYTYEYTESSARLGGDSQYMVH